MKKVLKPSQPEDCVYYSDFSGKLLDHNMVPVTITIDCGYGSKYDEAKWEIHLTDTELSNLLVFIKDGLCQETKDEIKRHLDTNCLSYETFYNKELFKTLI